MATRFEFATATRIIFGPGTLKQIGSIAAEFGRRAFVVTGTRPDRAGPLLDRLAASHLYTEVLSIEGEPDIELVSLSLSVAREAKCDLVIGFGGGSALDTGKAIAALLTNPGQPLDYLEVIGQGQPLTQPALPYIAIPTTAGTGSEVTRNAVLASPRHRAKASLRSPLMLPRVALIDPELTYTLPPAITASTGLDALTQLIEPYVSIKANPLIDAICREGLQRAARSLQRAYENGTDPAARADMSLASLCGGLALANAGLGAVHGFAAVIGGMFAAPHGAICAALLPQVMSINLQALRARLPDSEALRRYTEVARILTGDDRATTDDGAKWVSDLCAALKIPPLKSYGITTSDFAVLIEKSAIASSMQANPLKLTPDELREILERAW